MTTPKPPIGAYVECDQPRPFDPSEERDRLAATLTPYGTTWDTHTSSMKDTARDLADPFLARTFREMASLRVQLHNALGERDEARRANGALLWQVDNAGCTASREGETTYECRADAPCGLCRLRAERDAARRAVADAERERDEARVDRDRVIGRGYGDDAYILVLEEKIAKLETTQKLADAIVANNSTTAELMRQAADARAQGAAAVIDEFGALADSITCVDGLRYHDKTTRGEVFDMLLVRLERCRERFLTKAGKHVEGE